MLTETQRSLLTTRRTRLVAEQAQAHQAVIIGREQLAQIEQRAAAATARIGELDAILSALTAPEPKAAPAPTA